MTSSTLFHRIVQLASLMAAMGAVGACDSVSSSGTDSSSAEVSKGAPGVAAELAEAAKVDFPLELPANYRALGLRGEGSEFLKAPPSAQVKNVGGTGADEQFLLTAGSVFQLSLRTRAPSLKSIEAQLSTRVIVMRADDALVVKEKSGYAFVVIRQLVPEWDETDRRQFSCSTPGLLSSLLDDKSPHLPTFSAVEVGAMVAACRSLSLPVLE